MPEWHDPKFCVLCISGGHPKQPATKPPVHNYRACGLVPAFNNPCVCPCPDCMANHQTKGKI